MTKIISILIFALGLGLTTAQQVTPNKPTKTTAKKAEHIQTEKKTSPYPSKSTAEPSVTNPTTKMKKDGTPDKRYKANYTTSKP